MSHMNNFIELIRPRHYVKNILVLVPMALASNPTGVLLDTGSAYNLFLTFVVFCLTASAVYAMNDAMDAKRDAEHPKKRHRPVASGRISVRQSLLIALMLSILALGLSILVSLLTTALLLTYIALNILYSAILKRVVILDIVIVSLGFPIRMITGMVAIGDFATLHFIPSLFFASVTLCFLKRFIKLGQSNSRMNWGYSGLYTVTTLISSIAVSSLVTMALVGAALMQPPVAIWIEMVVIVPITAFILSRVLIQCISTQTEPTEIVYHDRTVLVSSVILLAAFLFINVLPA
ncbi:MAG: UbiA prenyltransferase family protein [Pseudomonadota bacterium]